MATFSSDQSDRRFCLFSRSEDNEAGGDDREQIDGSKVPESGDNCSDECKVAWDLVEEISQAKAHLREKLEHKEDHME
ncbi:hypothetical protein R6Q59_014307 [Mikania micrantha]